MKEVISVKELLIAIAIFVQSLLPDHLTSSNCLLYFSFVFFCPESHFEFQKCCCYETLLFAVDFKSRASTISFLFLLLFFVSDCSLFLSLPSTHSLHPRRATNLCCLCCHSVSLSFCFLSVCLSLSHYFHQSFLSLSFSFLCSEAAAPRSGLQGYDKERPRIHA